MQAHVSSACFKCFRGMLQLFHMDVTKVDQGCCTYCKCFTSMLQLFHMDVASKSGMLHILQVFQRHVASVSKVLFKMFHLFQTYVASVLK